MVLGSFNPAIFHPQWFKASELLNPEECEAADNVVLTKDLASFHLPWCRVQSFNDRFSVETTDSARIITLSDLVVGTFNLLEHCPITSTGFSRFFHVQLESEMKTNKIWDLLSPKAMWEEVIPSPRTNTISIEGENKEEKGIYQALHAKIEPSARVEHGVFFEVHQRYTISSNNRSLNDSEIQHLYGEGHLLRQKIQDDWIDFLSKSESITNHLLKKFRESLSE